MEKSKHETLLKWVEEELTEYHRDVADHGCINGFPGVTTYSETCALYEQYEDEIWELLTKEDHEDQGPVGLIASFSGIDQVHCATTFKNLLVWFAVEHYSMVIADCDGCETCDQIQESEAENV